MLSVHPAVQQPLHRTFRNRRQDRFLAPPFRRIVNDDSEWPGYVRLGFGQQARHLPRNGAGR